MSTTDERVRSVSGTLAQRFSAYLETVTSPSDIALLVRSFELSLRAANKSPKTTKSYTDTVREYCLFLVENGMPTEPASMYVRSAPAHMARTTSLTVVSILFFSFLASARLAAAKATRRRACTATLMEVRGAVNGRAALAVCPWRMRRIPKMLRVVRSIIFPTSKGATRLATMA